MRTTFDIRDKLKKISSSRQCSLYKDMKGWVHLLDFDLELGHHFVKGAFGETPHKHCQRHKGPKGCVLSPKYLILVLSQVGQNSASESRPNFDLLIWTKVLAQNLS